MQNLQNIDKDNRQDDEPNRQLLVIVQYTLNLTEHEFSLILLALDQGALSWEASDNTHAGVRSNSPFRNVFSQLLSMPNHPDTQLSQPQVELNSGYQLAPHTGPEAAALPTSRDFCLPLSPTGFSLIGQAVERAMSSSATDTQETDLHADCFEALFLRLEDVLRSPSDYVVQSPNGNVCNV